MLSFINENAVLDFLKGFGVRIRIEPPLIKSTIKNEIANDGLLRGLKDSVKFYLYDNPKDTILHPKDTYNHMLQFSKDKGLNPIQAHGISAAEMGLGLARPAVPLAAGAYGVHKALEDDDPLEQAKSVVSDTVDNVKDKTMDFVDDHPVLAGAAGLGGTALAGGALYNYLKNRKKK